MGLVLCRAWNFIVDSSAPVDEVLGIFRALERRGAFFTHLVKGQWRINIPTSLEWEPFMNSMAEEDWIEWVQPEIRSMHVDQPAATDLWEHQSALPSS